MNQYEDYLVVKPPRLSFFLPLCLWLSSACIFSHKFIYILLWLSTILCLSITSPNSGVKLIFDIIICSTFKDWVLCNACPLISQPPVLLEYNNFFISAPGFFFNTCGQVAVPSSPALLSSSIGHFFCNEGPVFCFHGF